MGVRAVSGRDTPIRSGGGSSNQEGTGILFRVVRVHIQAELSNSIKRWAGVEPALLQNHRSSVTRDNTHKDNHPSLFTHSWESAQFMPGP